jgi:proteic killer suppression protein
MIKKVELTASLQKKIIKLPPQIQKKFRIWIKQIEIVGLENVRKIKGYHDEPLTGDRLGQRSIRLNIAYRAFYIEISRNKIEIAEVSDINKHKY